MVPDMHWEKLDKKIHTGEEVLGDSHARGEIAYSSWLIAD
jgi:hypothetical protein